MLIQGKTAVVTGANRGIGRAVLEVFARHGVNVWACVRTLDAAFAAAAQELAQSCNVTITPVGFDLAVPEQVKAGARTILAAKQPIDILVNNAGAIHNALFQMTSTGNFQQMFQTNFFAPMALTQSIVKTMTRQRSGSIINIASSAALDGNAGRTAYASSKAAMVCATKVMARELGQFGIRVNALAPGLTDTDMMKQSTPDDALADTLQHTCLQRVGEPAEIANAVLFLASGLSSYITGQVLRVDGGM